MKLFTLCILLLLSSLTLAGTDIQNGGAGISVEGKVATFYRSTAKVDIVDSTVEIEKLKQIIGGLRISAETRVELDNLVTPSSERSYYSVLENSYDKNVLNEIKKEYSSITGVSVENITIFALTDSKAQITLLFPDFQKLSSKEKISILLHESLWISGRVKSYRQMLEIDKTFQAMLDYEQDCLAKFNFYKNIEALYEASTWALNAAYGCEVKKYYSLVRKDALLSNLFDLKNSDTLAKIILASFFEDDASILLFNKELDTSLDISTKGPFNVTRLAIRKLIINHFRLELTDKYSNLPFVLDKSNYYGEENIHSINQILKQATLGFDPSPDSYDFGILIPYLGKIEIK